MLLCFGSKRIFGVVNVLDYVQVAYRCLLVFAMEKCCVLPVHGRSPYMGLTFQDIF